MASLDWKKWIENTYIVLLVEAAEEMEWGTVCPV